MCTEPDVSRTANLVCKSQAESIIPSQNEGLPKGTSSRRFQEQSTTARPLALMSSWSWHDTHALPMGLRITPGKGIPSRSSRTTCQAMSRSQEACSLRSWIYLCAHLSINRVDADQSHSVLRSTLLFVLQKSDTPLHLARSRHGETSSTFCLTSRVPVHLFLSHWPRSHIASLKGTCRSCHSQSIKHVLCRTVLREAEYTRPAYPAPYRLGTALIFLFILAVLSTVATISPGLPVSAACIVTRFGVPFPASFSFRH